MHGHFRLLVRGVMAGADQWILAKLIEHLARRRGYEVTFEVVPHGIVGCDFLALNSLDLQPLDGMSMGELRVLIREIKPADVMCSKPLRALAPGSFERVRQIIDRERQDLLLLQQAGEEEFYATGKHEGPACREFIEKAGVLMDYIGELLQRRLGVIPDRHPADA